MIDLECRLCLEEALKRSQMQCNDLDAFRGFLQEMYNTMSLPTACPHFPQNSSCVTSTELLVTIPTNTFPLSSPEGDRKIITLIGSLEKAKITLSLANTYLSASGFIVLGPGLDIHSQLGKEVLRVYEKTREDLEILYYDKIIMSDAVYVINPNYQDEEYLDVSSQEEVAFARSLGKEIWWYNVHICKENCQCKVMH